MSACTSEVTVELRYPSQAVRGITREVRAFVFGAPQENLNCRHFEPQGGPPGDAEARSGRTAELKLISGPVENLGTLGTHAPGNRVLVIEAWSPPCAEVTADAEGVTSCARLGEGEPVLRGYACLEVEASELASPLAMELTPLAGIGAVMQVPEDLPRYGAAAPLVVAEGLTSNERLVVQLINEQASDAQDVPVWWGAPSGGVTLTDGALRPSGQDTILGGGGFSTQRVRGGLEAAGGAAVPILAHAAGFDGSPIRFDAVVVRNVRIKTQALPIPEQVPSEFEFHSAQILLEDLDGDGRLDIVTYSGRNNHRLVVYYAQGDGYLGYASPERPQMARALTMATVNRQRFAVLSLANAQADPQNVEVAGETRRAFVLQEPALEFWSGLQTRPPGAVLTATPQRHATLSQVPLTKTAIYMHAADIDGDGNDELALSRCSFLYAERGDAQDPRVRCYGNLTDLTDSEVAVLRLPPGDANPANYQEIAAITTIQRADGGFRAVRFVDIDADGIRDLVFTADATINAICGRNQPGAAFGFRNEFRQSEETLGVSYDFAVGRYNEDQFLDIVTSSGVRASGPYAGLKRVSGGQGCILSPLTGVIDVGPRGSAPVVLVRGGDFNRDNFGDLAIAHRGQRTLALYFGGPSSTFAVGPQIDLPVHDPSELAVGTETVNGEEQVVMAMVGGNDRTLFVARVTVD